MAPRLSSALGRSPPGGELIGGGAALAALVTVGNSGASQELAASFSAASLSFVERRVHTKRFATHRESWHPPPESHPCPSTRGLCP